MVKSNTQRSQHLPFDTFNSVLPLWFTFTVHKGSSHFTLWCLHQTVGADEFIHECGKKKKCYRASTRTTSALFFFKRVLDHAIMSLC